MRCEFIEEREEGHSILVANLSTPSTGPVFFPCFHVSSYLCGLSKPNVVQQLGMCLSLVAKPAPRACPHRVTGHFG